MKGGKPPPSPKCLPSLGILRIKRRTYDRREGRDCRYACFYLCMCMYTCVQVPTEALGWYWNHRSWSHRWLRVTHIDAGNQTPVFCKGSLLAHWALFPAPLLLFISASSALVTLFPSFFICNIVQLKEDVLAMKSWGGTMNTVKERQNISVLMGFEPWSSMSRCPIYGRHTVT